MDNITYEAGGMWASTCVVNYTYFGNGSYGIGYDKPKRRECMTLYKVFCVDRNVGKLTSEHTLVGNDKEDAALELVLTDAEKALKLDDDLDIIWQSVGTFEKRVVERIRMDR